MSGSLYCYFQATLWFDGMYWMNIQLVGKLDPFVPPNMTFITIIFYLIMYGTV